VVPAAPPERAWRRGTTFALDATESLCLRLAKAACIMDANSDGCDDDERVATQPEDPPPQKESMSGRSSACTFVLGFGAQLPFAVATLVLPWLNQAASRPPAAPAILLAGLPSFLSAALSTSNAFSVILVARRVARARPVFTVVVPMLLCAAVLATASMAAYMEASEATALSGRCVVFAALPMAVVLGSFAAVLSCGASSLATTVHYGGLGVKFYSIGQSIASFSTASISFYAAYSVMTGDSELAPHAAATLFSAAITLVLCLGAYFALPRRASSALSNVATTQEAPRPCDVDSLTAPLLDGDDQVGDDDNSPVAEASVEQPPLRTADLRLYKISLFLTFFMTCAVYPGISSFLRPAGNVSWCSNLLVPATFVVFTGSDLVGRLVAAAVPKATARPLLLLAITRSALVPCICMCNIRPPSGNWAAPRVFAGHNAWPFFWLAIAALTNGFITASALSAGPSCRPVHCRGGVATRMLAWLVGGVTTGSLFSIALALTLQRLKH